MLIELKCPNCNAIINLDNSREFGFCSYCGTKIMLIRSYKIDGIKTDYQQLSAARKMIEIEEFFKAKMLLEQIVKESPENGEAWFELSVIELKKFKKYKNPYFIQFDKPNGTSPSEVKNRLSRLVKSQREYEIAKKLLGMDVENRCNKILEECNTIIDDLLDESNKKIRRIMENIDLLNGYHNPGNADDEPAYEFFSYDNKIYFTDRSRYYEINASHGATLNCTLRTISDNYEEFIYTINIYYIDNNNNIYTSYGQFGKNVNHTNIVKESYKRLLKFRKDNKFCIKCGSEVSFFGRCKNCGTKA